MNILKFSWILFKKRLFFNISNKERILLKEILKNGCKEYKIRKFIKENNNQNWTNKKIINVAENFTKILKENFEKAENKEFIKNVINLIENSNNSIYISCFSEINNNELMWAHYADRSTGYCIEYDIKDYLNSLQGKSVLDSLFPVTYAENKNDDWLSILLLSGFKSIFSKYSGVESGVLFFNKEMIKICCRKKLDWKYEKERRIITDKSADLPGPKIKSVIVGDKITNDKFNKIREICESKGIEIKIIDDDKNNNLYVRSLTDTDISKIKKRI